MLTLTKKYLPVAIVAGVMAAAATAETAGDFASMIKKGEASLDFRYRLETVDQDNALKDATASTLKSRLTLKSADYKGFSALFEVDNVSVIGSDDYDSFVLDNKRGTYSVVADPKGTDVNQAFIAYKLDAKSGVKAGRQRILHDTQRFVGGVGWRQNEQTYDSLSYNFSSDKYTLDYSYVWKVNRIFGSSDTSVQLDEFDSDSHFLLASGNYKFGKLSGYVYALDFEEDSPVNSNITYGVGYTGAYKMLTLTAGLATQSDYGDNPNDYDSLYYLVDLSAKLSPITMGVGYEVLGSDDGAAGSGFKTPLATLHKFQGWADTLLGTPDTGIEDLYLKLSGKIGKLAMAAFYHDFSAEEGNADYGTELDMVATYPISENFSAQLKYAAYDADDRGVDTDKFWLTLNLKL